MEGKIYQGIFGTFYKVSNGVVLASQEGVMWHRSNYGDNLVGFQDGIGRGYLVEVKQ